MVNSVLAVSGSSWSLACAFRSVPSNQLVYCISPLIDGGLMAILSTVPTGHNKQKRNGLEISFPISFQESFLWNSLDY